MKKRLFTGVFIATALQGIGDAIATEFTKADAVAAVEINANKTEVDDARDFVSGRITIDQQRIKESGAQTVAQVLRSEPAITVGKNGLLGLMGLAGYTQILVDGKPADSDNPLELNVMQVERIEIIKSATAVTGPLGIAGTINIVRRNIVRKASTQTELGAETAHGAHGTSATWMRTQASRDTPLSYSLSLSADRIDKNYFSRYTQNSNDGPPLIAGEKTRTGRSESLAGRGVFSLALSAEHKVSTEPSFMYLRLDGYGTEQRHTRTVTAAEVSTGSDTPLSTVSLPVKWVWRLDEDSELKVQATTMLIRSHNNADLNEFTAAQGHHSREQNRRSDALNHFLDLDYTTSITGGHDLSAGIRVVRNRRANTYADFIDHQPDLTSAVLGTGNLSRLTRYQLYVQDDWRISKTLAAGLGLNTEHRVYDLDEMSVASRSRFTMWSPTLHVAKKLGENGKHQLRLSLARTFQPPNIDQMFLHPYINPLAPCFPQRPCIPNGFATADSIGNPYLEAERAIGVNLSYRLKLAKASEIGVELYSRNIANKIGTQAGFESVPWSDWPRYIARPVNLGAANIRGIDLTARIDNRDLWNSAPALILSGSVGFAHSEVKSIASGDNRIPGQLPWRAKIAATYAATNLPLKLNMDANWLPADWVRYDARLRNYEASRFTVNMNGSWTLAAGPSVTVTVEDITAGTRHGIDEYRTDEDQQRRYTRSRADTRIALKLNFNN